MTKTSICLNMIVKNESHIILNTFENLLKYFNFTYWIISDTGSTDNTCEIITNYFKEKKIPGELYKDEWKDFGYNRTQALKYAYNKSDYLLIFDADDSIIGDFKLPLILDSDKYNLYFSNITKYIRPLLINNRKHWKFECVLHEYLTNIDPIYKVKTIEGDYYINSGRTSHRNKNTNKYLQDAIILEDALKDNDCKYKERYTFYCANSYRDSNNFNKAIEYYKKVLQLNNWNQEKYVSALNIGNIYKTKNNMEEALNYWYKAILYDKERLDSIINIMEYYYSNHNHFIINCLYSKIKDYKITDVSSKLFIFSKDN